MDHALHLKRNVIVAVFSAPPTIGWMLYFSGFKRSPVISKRYDLHPSAADIMENALRHLAYELVDESDPVGVRIINAADGSVVSGIPTHLLSPFTLRDKPIFGEDVDVLAYLFSKAPISSPDKKRIVKPMPVSGTQLVPSSEELVIIAADASFKSESEYGVNVGGTGWVIDFHDESSAPVIEVGSKNYVEHEDGHYFDANVFEMYAVRDALLHFASLKDSRSVNASRAFLYTDSTFVVRALLDRKVQVPLENTVNQIHDLIESLAIAGVKVEYMWTKGHADNKWNQTAHEMAAVGRSTPVEAFQ